MATITFLAGQGSETIAHLQGSGLGFYGFYVWFVRTNRFVPR